MKHLGDITKMTGATTPIVDIVTGATAVWASEIEEFCIAVTKKRFGKD